MANQLDFRALRADETMVRFKTNNKKENPTGAIYLLYKDARCDMRILDEVFGAFGWSREHKMLDGKLYCSVAIKNPETGEWIVKDDAGEETQVEATKGEASDAFKRACFNWGIGRELYTGPKKIEIPFEGDYELSKKMHYGLYVSEMVVNDHRIDKLVISDKYKVRFSWVREGANKSPLDMKMPPVPHATMHRVGSGEKAKPIPTPEHPQAMTKEEFRSRWLSDESGGGITNEDCANCAVAWGLCATPRIRPIKEIVDMVVKAAGITEKLEKASSKKVTTKEEAMKVVKQTLPRLQTIAEVKKLWDCYPLYQNDVDFKALFSARKQELQTA